MANSTALATPVGRRCVVCSHPSRAGIEEMLASGTMSIRAVSRHHDVDRDAVRRHLARHVTPAIRRAVAMGAPGLDAPQALTVMARILSVADTAHEIASLALIRGDHGVALRAGRSEVQALTTLVERLGIRPGDVATEVADAESFAPAVIRAARADPQIASSIAQHLRESGRDDLARLVLDQSTHSLAQTEPA